MNFKLKLKNFKQKILKDKKYTRIFIFMIIFNITFFITSTLEGNNYGDRLWNFQFSYKIYNGFKVYKDIAMLQTPLYFYIESAMFKIFSPNYIVVHVLNAIINTFMYYSVYEIFKYFIKSKLKSLVYTIIVMLGTVFILFDGGAYTSLAIAIYLFGITLKLKNKCNWFIDGILIFLIFISKQNVAILYSASLVIEYFVLKRENIRESFKYLLKSFITLSILLLCFIFLLVYNESLYDFINYCFLGLKEFIKNVKVSFYFVFSICLIIICNFILRYHKYKLKLDLNISILYVYSMFMILVAYPIFDNLHLSLGMVATITLFIVLVDKFCFNKNVRKEVKMLLYLFIISISFIAIILNIYYVYNCSTKSLKYEIYRGSYVLENDTVQEEIEDLIDFIENQDKKVIIISHKTAIYNNIFKGNNGIFDLPFLGNMGSEGEEGLIKKLAELQNTYILIVKDEKNMIWQESMKARQYIMDNYTLKGEINEFLIYETK